MSQGIKKSVRLVAATAALWLVTTAIVVAQVESAQVRVDGMT